MSEKKNLLLNSDVCDTRKMKEEDYSHYENIIINADIVIVSEESKGILSRLPVSNNSDITIELADDEDVHIKTVNGAYEIGENSNIEEHTILCVNGFLEIRPGTEEALKKYVRIVVNGSIKYPKSLEGYMSRITVNGSTDAYPDDGVILDSVFTLNKYFPLRAREGSKYYVKKIVIIEDENVDMMKLVEKNVHFCTKKLLVPECKVEDSAPIFDENVEFIVVPDGMKLVYGNCILNEELLRREGRRIFIYGDVKVADNADFVVLRNQIEKMIIEGTVRLKAEQEADFYSMNIECDKIECDKIEIMKKNRKIKNMARVKLDKQMFENAPDGIEVKKVAVVKIAEDVTPDMIWEKLVIKNCATVLCSTEQESAVMEVSKNVATISSGQKNSSGANSAGRRDVFFGDRSGLFGNIDGLVDGLTDDVDGLVDGLTDGIDGISDGIDGLADGAAGLSGGISGLLRGLKKFSNSKIVNTDNYVM